MKNYLITFLMILLLTTLAHAEDKKLAQTGMKFLSVTTEARAASLGSALTARQWGSAAMFHNPASMTGINGFVDASFSQMKWIADINYLAGTVAYRPQNGDYGIFGISFLSVDYGDLNGTVRAVNDQGFLDTGIFSPTAFSFGFGYAISLTNKFSIGTHVKYVKQSLTGGLVEFDPSQLSNSKNFKEDVVAFDFGLLYQTGFKSLNIGMTVRNFSQEVKYIEDAFELPLLFEIGVSMNAFDLMEMDADKHALYVSVDRTHPRDFAEQFDVGLEYVFQNIVSLRMGFTSPSDEQSINLGAGVKQEISGYNLGVDYSYTDYGVFNDLHRFSVNFSL